MDEGKGPSLGKILDSSGTRRRSGKGELAFNLLAHVTDRSCKHCTTETGLISSLACYASGGENRHTTEPQLFKSKRALGLKWLATLTRHLHLENGEPRQEALVSLGCVLPQAQTEFSRAFIAMLAETELIQHPKQNGLSTDSCFFSRRRARTGEDAPELFVKKIPSAILSPLDLESVLSYLSVSTLPFGLVSGASSTNRQCPEQVLALLECLNPKVETSTHKETAWPSVLDHLTHPSRKLQPIESIADRMVWSWTQAQNKGDKKNTITARVLNLLLEKSCDNNVVRLPYTQRAQRPLLGVTGKHIARELRGFMKRNKSLRRKTSYRELPAGSVSRGETITAVSHESTGFLLWHGPFPVARVSTQAPYQLSCMQQSSSELVDSLERACESREAAKEWVGSKDGDASRVRITPLLATTESTLHARVSPDLAEQSLSNPPTGPDFSSSTTAEGKYKEQEEEEKDRSSWDTHVIHRPRPLPAPPGGIVLGVRNITRGSKHLASLAEPLTAAPYAFKQAKQASRHRDRHFQIHKVYHKEVAADLKLFNKKATLIAKYERHLSPSSWNSASQSIWKRPVYWESMTGSPSGKVGFAPDSRKVRIVQNPDLWQCLLAQAAQSNVMQDPTGHRLRPRQPGERPCPWDPFTQIWTRLLGFPDLRNVAENSSSDANKQTLQLILRLSSSVDQDSPTFEMLACDDLGVWPRQCLQELSAILATVRTASLWRRSRWSHFASRTRNLAVAGMFLLAARGDVYGASWRHLLSLLRSEDAELATARLVTVPCALKLKDFGTKTAGLVPSPWVRGTDDRFVTRREAEHIALEVLGPGVWARSGTQIDSHPQQESGTALQVLSQVFPCPRLVALLQAHTRLVSENSTDNTILFRAWVSVWTSPLVNGSWCIFDARVGLVCVVSEAFHTARIVPWNTGAPSLHPRDLQEECDLFRARLTIGAFYVARGDLRAWQYTQPKPNDSFLEGGEGTTHHRNTESRHNELLTVYGNNGPEVEELTWSRAEGLHNTSDPYTPDRLCALCGLSAYLANLGYAHDLECTRLRASFDTINSLDLTQGDVRLAT